ncbi:tail fiber domain-containing protein [Ichthyenterobacterium sp. W332]|uniref:Tail fiber domain-containing protein n=1 Tax=Microcosmobacter mediterraneus TaxID=3075607 RepID=A0ABU2YFY6_9FLAO|nr:tail fiber domain-containing protein [Ichthyenterobacterium sp. W332]MDT0557090.1 tail fiber domain-containing protein [Ichthyenterobacterium sp. W332]
MKKLVSLLFIIAFTSVGIAQNGINYKALIKDANGNVLSQQQIDIKFTIQYDSGSVFGIVTEYSEIQTVTTDQNGIIVVVIGQGNVIAGNLSNSNWGENLYMITEIDIEQDGSYINFGNEFLNTVPKSYRSQISDRAITAITAENMSGLEAIDEGNGIGHRLIGRDPNNYGNIGLDAVDLSISSFSSNIRGASGAASFSVGDATISSGAYSLAGGQNSVAEGNVSMAYGLFVRAEGRFSVAFGDETRSDARNTFTIGRFNIGGGNSESWISTDPLFEVGNGTTNGLRNNALTVLKNGNLGVNTAEPEVKLHVTGGTDAGLNQDGGYVVLGDTNGRHMVFDNNEIMVKEGNQPETLFLNNDGGFVSVGGTIINSSDRRLKKEIEKLPYGLNEVLQLTPKQYYWKNRGEQNYKSIGLIAQEVQPIINEIVHKANNEDKTLSVSYIELIPVLINAIQEQQEIINSLKNDNKLLQEELLQVVSNYNNFLSRIEKLEAQSSN